MKTLVIYYSLDGNCRKLGGMMAKALSADEAEIIAVDQSIPGKRFLGVLKLGRESIMKKTPDIAPLEKNIQDYDLIIVGGPVWAWNISAPMRTFLTQTEWNGKPVATFCMHANARGFTLATMRKLIDSHGGRVVGEANFRDFSHANPEETQKGAEKWASGVVAGMEGKGQEGGE